MAKFSARVCLLMLGIFALPLTPFLAIVGVSVFSGFRDWLEAMRDPFGVTSGD